MSEFLGPFNVLPSGKTIINPKYTIILVGLACDFLWQTIQSDPDYLWYWAQFSYGVFLLIVIILYHLVFAHYKGQVHWILGIEGPRSIGIFHSKNSPAIVKNKPKRVVIILSKIKDPNYITEVSPKSTKDTYK